MRSLILALLFIGTYVEAFAPGPAFVPSPMFRHRAYGTELSMLFGKKKGKAPAPAPEPVKKKKKNALGSFFNPLDGKPVGEKASTPAPVAAPKKAKKALPKKEKKAPPPKKEKAPSKGLAAKKNAKKEKKAATPPPPPPSGGFGGFFGGKSERSDGQPIMKSLQKKKLPFEK
jgi:hypothetical protein